MFNQAFNKSSPRNPYPLLQVICKVLCAGGPVALQGVIFYIDQLDEIGKEKPGITSLNRYYPDLTLRRFDRSSDKQESRVFPE